ncbi:MAG TPA: hypothetical protein VNC50_00995, partial [Planctomycetia bacterium]|nr:hypothetical protein [Planctomycetia bacterium]
ADFTWTHAPGGQTTLTLSVFQAHPNGGPVSPAAALSLDFAWTNYVGDGGDERRSIVAPVAKLLNDGVVYSATIEPFFILSLARCKSASLSVDGAKMKYGLSYDDTRLLGRFYKRLTWYQKRREGESDQSIALDLAKHFDTAPIPPQE